MFADGDGVDCYILDVWRRRLCNGATVCGDAGHSPEMTMYLRLGMALHWAWSLRLSRLFDTKRVDFEIVA